MPKNSQLPKKKQKKTKQIKDRRIQCQIHGTRILKGSVSALALESSDVSVMQDISSTQPDEITKHVCANLRVIKC